jgi:hypothetical protein
MARRHRPAHQSPPQAPSHPPCNQPPVTPEGSPSARQGPNPVRRRDSTVASTDGHRTDGCSFEGTGARSPEEDWSCRIAVAVSRLPRSAEPGVSRSTFYDWRAKGRAPCCLKLSNGELRIHRADLESPIQGRTSLEAVRTQQRTGPRLVAFFDPAPARTSGGLRRGRRLAGCSWGNTAGRSLGSRTRGCGTGAQRQPNTRSAHGASHVLVRRPSSWPARAPPAGFEPATHGLGNRRSIP